MSLKNSHHGYRFAEYEKELIFHRRNTGLVQYKSTDGRVFSLNISKNFDTLKDEIFYAPLPPTENTYIEVEVESEDIAQIRDGEGWKKHVLKKICGWNSSNPSLSART